LTAGSGAARQRWRAAPSQSLVWADYGPDSALYHRPSGQTHFVNAAAALLLREILSEPLDAPGATRALSEAAELADPLPAQLDEYVTTMLHRLEELGLVERVG
jgi:PqqD family protein of HPr-rel-A system